MRCAVASVVVVLVATMLPSAAGVDFSASSSTSDVPATVTVSSSQYHGSEARDQASSCRQAGNAPRAWTTMSDLAASATDMTFGCRANLQGRYYTMLNAYRRMARRPQWMYASDLDEFGCLQYWMYYDTSLQPLENLLRTTKRGDVFGLRWCALPVFDDTEDRYLTDHSEGKLWAYCNCTET